MDGSWSRWVGVGVLAFVIGMLATSYWWASRDEGAPAQVAMAAPDRESPRPASPRAAPRAAPVAEASEAEDAGATEDVESGPPPPSGPPSAPPSEATPSSPPAPDGPAMGPWPELSTAAQMQHPDTDPFVAGWYDLVGYFREGDPTGTRGGNPSGDWTNKAEIWDGAVSVLLADVSGLGTASTEPYWPEVTEGSGIAGTRWSNSTTEGRGEFVEFRAQYVDAAGETYERVYGILVRTSPEARGTAVTSMPPFSLAKRDFTGYVELTDEIRQREWDWVLAQGPG